MKKIPLMPLVSLVFLMSQCYVPQWIDKASLTKQEPAPTHISTIFQAYPDNTICLKANSPGRSYKFDIGEKDAVYDGHLGAFNFDEVKIQLLDHMPKGSILVNISFIDKLGNVAKVDNFDLMRIIPKYDTHGDMLYSEILLEEFTRFGVVFRREHKEFDIVMKETIPQVQIMKQTVPHIQKSADQIYRMAITNNCLEPTKWEMNLTSEDFSDFKTRRKGGLNLNQNKILSHCWFYLQEDLYMALRQYKNSNVDKDYFLPYDSLNMLGEATVIDFESLRYPLKTSLNPKVLEVGHQSNRIIEPIDIEAFYKWDFGLFLTKRDKLTYRTILETPMEIARFTDAGFYNEETPNTYDYSYLKYIDDVEITTIDAPQSDCYTEIKLTGEYAPYEITIGNIDLAYPDEQKLTGLLFGYNTYPKNRRYNPVVSTLFYHADDFPKLLQPYVVLTDKSNGKWVNNQPKGIDKIYLSYENSERDILQIYVLSYERVTPVWMARVKLPKNIRETVRIRRNLYNY